MSFGRTITAALAAAALTAAPVAAQAAAPRAAAPVAGERLAGEGLEGAWFVPLLVVAAVLLGVYLLADNENPELPHSP